MVNKSHKFRCYGIAVISKTKFDLARVWVGWRSLGYSGSSLPIFLWLKIVILVYNLYIKRNQGRIIMAYDKTLRKKRGIIWLEFEIKKAGDFPQK